MKNNLLRKIRRGVHTTLELMIIYVINAVVTRLSRRGELRLAATVGSALFRTARRTRRIAMANLDIVFRDSKSAAEKRDIAKASFVNAAQILFDYFWFSRDSKNRIALHCVCDDPVIDEWIKGDFPGFIVTGHIGNWEVSGNFVSGCGRKIWSVYRPIGTQKTLDRLSRFRRSTGQQIIPKEGAATGILRALRNGDLVALVMDQHSDLREGGIYLDFFGLPATFSNLCGVIANRLKVPVCVACVKYDAERDKYGVHSYGVLNAEEVTALTPEQITAKIAALIGKMILDNPTQWLWGYRRWKRCPADGDLSRYPFYALREW